MAQTKLGSFVESWANIAVGFTINWTANMVFLPLFGFTTLTAAKAFGIGLVFTAISFARQYILRRVFNRAKFGNTPDGYSAAASAVVGTHFLGPNIGWTGGRPVGGYVDPDDAAVRRPVKGSHE